MNHKAYITFKEYLQSLSSNDINDNITKIRDIDPWQTRLLMINTPTTEATKQYIEYDDMNNLVFGQFIALENYITKTTKQEDKLLGIATLVIRKEGEYEFDNIDVDLENKHNEDILNEPYTYVMECISKFFVARNKFINETFLGVFYVKPDDKDEDDDDDEPDVNNSDGNWYWYSLIRTLANEDVTKYEDIQMLTMDKVAPEVAYLRHIQVKEEHERKLEEFKRKAKSGTN